MCFKQRKYALQSFPVIMLYIRMQAIIQSLYFFEQHKIFIIEFGEAGSCIDWVVGIFMFCYVQTQFNCFIICRAYFAEIINLFFKAASMLAALNSSLAPR